MNKNPAALETLLPSQLPDQLPRHVHIIGICGVLSSAIACALHRAGITVTGSDKGFYPPVSTQLEKVGVPFYAGWHPEKMIAGGVPDLVIVTTASGSKNPETAYVREHGIPTASYTDVLRKYFVKSHSIVCVGTWGKTTTSAILAYILEKAGGTGTGGETMDPSYMFGGVSMSQDTAARLGTSNWSVLEGDEYKSGTDDPLAKFFYYAPTHLLMTGLAWDHADLYPTEAAYMDAFRKLVRMTKENAKHLAAEDTTVKTGRTIAACADDETLMTLLAEENIRPITYGATADAEYRYENVTHTAAGLSFDMVHAGKKYAVKSPMLGRYNVENIAGCFAMAHSIGIAAEKIIAAIADFAGIKRRLERRTDAASPIAVIDAHAPTPDKARSVLESLAEVYPGGLIAIFEPNIGGRQRASIAAYDNAFEKAEYVLIPRLTKLKIDAEADPKDMPIEGAELAGFIKKTHPHTEYIEEDDALLARALELARAKKNNTTAIVFLGSHGFRNMIEATTEKLSTKTN